MTAEEPVGSLADEAAKLIAAMQDRARRDEGRDRADGQASAHAGEECRWCPLCQAVRAAKATSPEVRDHLTQAGLSFVLAIKALLEESERPPRPATPVEKIDLSEG